MTYLCPVCNGMQSVDYACSRCGYPMTDYGRASDFDGWDPYSPYLEIDMMKESDGIPEDAREHRCPHVFVCESCGRFTRQLFDEIFLA